MVNPCIGIIGGTGQLGGAIAQGLLGNGFISPERLWISSRSGRPENSADVDTYEKIQFTTCNQDLIDNCDIVIIAVPPHLFPSLNIKVKALDGSESLLISVMAGVRLEQIQLQTGARRVIRGMSNPAAEKGLAYSPWIASAAVTTIDKDSTHRLFEAFGQTDEVFSEHEIDQFTGLIGPVPGFVAYYADCMVEYAVNNGITSVVAERAIRQLFHASGVVMAESDASPKEHVEIMVEYAGTTAAGLNAMKNSPLAASIEDGLEAAFTKSKSIV